jgi:hypothetical protein
MIKNRALLSSEQKEKKSLGSRVPVAHACNPSYSGRVIRRIAVQSQPYLEKTPSQKRAGGVAQGVGP